LKQGFLYSIDLDELCKEDLTEDIIKKEYMFSEWDCIKGFPKMLMKRGGIWHTNQSSIMRNGKHLLPYKDAGFFKLKIHTAL